MRDLFIAGDWGSTSMRLHLCRPTQSGAEVIESASGPGVKFCQDFEGAFFEAVQPWLDRYGHLPAMLAGMIGSNIGWVDTPYAPCPANGSTMRDAVRRFAARGVTIGISGGMRCTNLFGLPDVMRGEEAQLFGWLASSRYKGGQHVVCLPGTHAKWAIVVDGFVTSFFTSMQGELFEILLAHSLIGRGLPRSELRKSFDASDPAFETGLTTILNDHTLSVELAVFSVRSRFVTGNLAASDAAPFLSGLLIGAEIRDAVAAHRARNIACDTVTLIGTEQLSALYARALSYKDIRAEQVPGHEASIGGLSVLMLGEQEFV